VLGDAPRPPADVSGLPGRGPQPRLVTGGLNVNISSREQVREFYNAVYTASTGVPIASTAITAECVPGTNSPAFSSATLLRINWFRAMGGLAASVTFDAGEGADDQAAAVMMSAQGELQHVGTWTNWVCFTAAGTNASANSNLALGSDGPDSITQYMLDFGTNNYEVGHRRYILYPQTQIMGAGDVPPQGTNLAANATWVFDANFYGPRPATRAPCVAWPPPGYVPTQVVYPQWSFSLSNADLSAATVTMASNGAPVAVTLQTYATGYGENTLVWHPTGLDPKVGTTVFPFSGTDTVYAITISNVVTAAGTNSFSYAVTLFDPAKTGADYFPLTISGTNQPAIKVGNQYSCTAAANPNITGYQWFTAQATNGNLVDNALNGTTNFLVSPAAAYPIITNGGSGACFHLVHLNAAAQFLQFNQILFPATNTTLSFKSMLGYASDTEVARVQVAAYGSTNWVDLYAQTGTNAPGETGPGETNFTQHSLSLSNYAGQQVLLRFNYDLTNIDGAYTYFPYIYPFVGWCLQNIVLTNNQQLLNLTTNNTSSTNFTFTPAQTNNYILAAQGVIFNGFPLDWGTPREVTAIVGPPVITLNAPSITNNQVKIKFVLSSGVATNFHLLQANQLNGTWATNGTAVLTTNTPGSAFQFTTTNGPAVRFYRVQTP
jgi:hypothetical protein